MFVDLLKVDLFSSEFWDVMVVMCVFVFFFDGFYDVVKSELGEYLDVVKWC